MTNGPLDARKPQRSGPQPRSVPGWLMVYAISTAIAVVIAGPLLFGGAARRVSYTEFKQMVRANDVAEVVISSTQIRGSLKKNDEQITAIPVEDPSLLGELEQHGVKVTGSVQTGSWDWILWLVPLALLMYLSTRGMPGLQGQGALSFGRSRAKVYAEDEVKITFADVAGIDEAIEELREIVDFLRSNVTLD